MKAIQKWTFSEGFTIEIASLQRYSTCLELRRACREDQLVGCETQTMGVTRSLSVCETRENVTI